eukprot:147791-Prorocentrum_minimum.AAC.1
MPPLLTRWVHIDRICPLSSPDWSTSTEHALSSRPIGLPDGTPLFDPSSPPSGCPSEPTPPYLPLYRIIRARPCLRVRRAVLSLPAHHSTLRRTNRVRGGGIFCQCGPIG